MPQVRRWHIYPNRAELETHAARAILRAAAQAVATSGSFTIVLAGGNTPRGIYAQLARARADWARWHVYFGDERCRPPGNVQRNDRMAEQTWLARVPIPRTQVYPMPAERGAAEGAQLYARVVAPVDRFEFVLLGLGEDGHTASLFPGAPLDGADALAVFDAPKAPAERVSLSATRLSRARQVMFVVSGASKRQATAAWRRDDFIPAAAIAPVSGVDILLDVSAWPDPFR